MSTETRIYDSYDGWERKIIIHHGGSESQIIYDSRDDWNKPKKVHNRRKFMPRTTPGDKEWRKDFNKVTSKVHEELEKARQNGDLK